jgi:hypothetical protein
MPITPDQIKRGIEIVGLVAAQVPNVLDWIGKYHIQIFQPGIFQGHEWLLAIPILIGIAGFAIILTSPRPLWYLIPLAVLALGIAGVIYEREQDAHDLANAVLLTGWTAWNTFLGLAALSAARLVTKLL